jgi:uncharacterized protein (DUF305 family)
MSPVSPSASEAERFEAETSEAEADEAATSDEPPPEESEAGSRSAFPVRSRRTALVAGVLAAVVLVLLGFAVGRLWPVFTSPGDDSPEAGFARDMALHHEQAVHMAMVEYNRGENETLHRQAYDIATNQQYQIAVMEGWLREWGLPLTSDQPRMGWVPDGASMIQPDGRMPGMASTDELRRLESATGKDADILFCQLMLRHHLGGVHMMDAILAQTDNGDVRELAERMRGAQQGEIEAFREMLTHLGAQP